MICSSIARHWHIRTSSWFQVPWAFVASERDHPCVMVADSLNLAPVVADVAVSRDDQPAAAGDLGDPRGVRRRWARDRAGRALAPVDDAARIAWVGDVGSQCDDGLRQAEHVSVEIEADGRRLGWTAHAARSDVS